MTKRILVVLMGVLLVASPVMAHCGKCGVGAEAAAHKGEGCPMHGTKNTTLAEASAALQESNPDLAKKLSDMAAHCCS